MAPKYYCKPYFKLSSRTAEERVTAAAAGSGPFTLPELCAAYQWPQNLAGGGTIAIVELGGGWVQGDMDDFFNSIGQPVPGIVDVSADGVTKNNPNKSIGNPRDPDVEVALDIQVAGAAYFVATGKPATIRVYWSRDIATAVRAATNDGCTVCSISWGSDEANWGQTAGDDMEAAAQAANTAGMAVFAASGDNNSSDGGFSPANVDLPASCPDVVGCGGTRKSAAAEVVWNNNPGKSKGEGTGGGYSTLFPPQVFQTGAPPPPAGSRLGRMVPDVSADADPNTGYIIQVHGQQVVGEGGTSAVAPLYAGLFAAFGTKLYNVGPKLWQNQSCFNDIKSGDNGTYSAAVGPDPCTGIGSPIGTKLAAIAGVLTAQP